MRTVYKTASLLVQKTSKKRHPKAIVPWHTKERQSQKEREDKAESTITFSTDFHMQKLFSGFTVSPIQ